MKVQMLAVSLIGFKFDMHRFDGRFTSNEIRGSDADEGFRRKGVSLGHC